jgi:hypothetical protein
LYLSGRLVDVPWGAWRNHGCVGEGYQLQVFIDNAGKHPVGVRRIACTFWEGNGDVYGLVILAFRKNGHLRGDLLLEMDRMRLFD